MAKSNNVVRTRRELMVSIATLHREGRLCKDLDRLPIDMAPRDAASVRCCPYKDRAVIKYRIMSLLGHGMESEVDELTSLGEHAGEAIARVRRGRKPSPEPSVLDLACDSCSAGGHYVTDACRGCVARPCNTTCPRNAITVHNGRAMIDSEACINCGLCTSACPFHAIIYRPVPCQDACPVDAISKDARGRIQIDHEKCVSCGRCLGACPFSAVMDRSQMVDVLEGLAGPRRVVAAVAPAGIGQFSAPFEKLVSACHDLGFDAVYEVAAGADEVAAAETEELIERIDGNEPFMTSSCCPAFVTTVARHLTGLASFVSHTPSPMIVTGTRIRAADPEALVVFVGPCLAKKREAATSGVIDYCISFEELGAMFVAAGIDVQECVPIHADETGSVVGRAFPVTGGVCGAIDGALSALGRKDGDAAITTTRIDGIDRETMKVLTRLGRNPEKGGPDGARFVEVMACPGGCVGGPLAYGNLRTATKAVQKVVAGA